MKAQILRLERHPVTADVEGRGACDEGHDAAMAPHHIRRNLLGTVAHDHINRLALGRREASGNGRRKFIELELNFRIRHLKFDELRNDFIRSDAGVRRHADDARQPVAVAFELGNKGILG